MYINYNSSYFFLMDYCHKICETYLVSQGQLINLLIWVFFTTYCLCVAEGAELYMCLKKLTATALGNYFNSLELIRMAWVGRDF